MKNQKIKLSLLLIAFVAMLNNICAQAPPLTCPFVVTNNLTCSVYINREVQGAAYSGLCCTSPSQCCPTKCNGQVCIAGGSTWTVPAACCAAGYDVIVTVLEVDGTGNCSGGNPCLVATTYACAYGANCFCAGSPTVTHPLTTPCCGNGYNVTWSASGITIF